MNQVMVAGHLGADPEVRFTSSGQKVTTIRIGARARRSGKDGTIWWRVTIWGEQFDKMIPYLKKGSPLIVFGDLSIPEIFTDRDGRPQVSMNITASSLQFSPFGKPESASSSGAPATQQHPAQEQVGQAGEEEGSMATAGQGKAAPITEDEIPF